MKSRRRSSPFSEEPCSEPSEPDHCQGGAVGDHGASITFSTIGSDTRVMQRSKGIGSSRRAGGLRQLTSRRPFKSLDRNLTDYR